MLCHILVAQRNSYCDDKVVPCGLGELKDPPHSNIIYSNKKAISAWELIRSKIATWEQF